MRWDIFCKVIDNHGDIGVCWRLSVQLTERGDEVRLWVDDASALTWMAPHGHPGIQVLPWRDQVSAAAGDGVIEAFGCELEQAFQSAIAHYARQSGRPPVWINLEYLSAEAFSERSHGLPSPVMSGPAAGLTKHFFYPGFTERTGGLLREPDLIRRQTAFDAPAWLRTHGLEQGGQQTIASLFCYEPAALAELLSHLAAGPEPTRLLVTAGRAAAAVRRALAGAEERGMLSVTWLPLLSQQDFDHLLWSCDLNLVRGEDSLVRALWAGKPFAWQIYPQDDGAHQVKLSAFLDWLRPPASLREFHLAWNGMAVPLPAPRMADWADCVKNARLRLLEQDDLASQLARFVGTAKKS